MLVGGMRLMKRLGRDKWNSYKYDSAVIGFLANKIDRLGHRCELNFL